MFSDICIVGGGSLGHVIAGWLAAKGMDVSILTRKPEAWNNELTINCPDSKLNAHIKKISSCPEDVIPKSGVVLLTVPGYANRQEILNIKPFLSESTFVGGVFCSSGFFFEALDVLPDDIPLWGFQRVPFISRVQEYGHSANLLSYRPEMNIAVEHTSPDKKEAFRKWVENAFGTPTRLMKNYLEVSITNSNPILHTSRLYTMFANWPADKRVENNILFYEEWTTEAADLMIKMDRELFAIIEKLPVTPGFIQPALEYYESHDAESLKNKLASIKGFKGILSPMKEDAGGWSPDYSSRYFTEDFGFSLKYIWQLGKKLNIDTPYIDKVYNWGASKLQN